MLRILLSSIALTGAAISANAQTLMVVESTNKTVMLLDEFNGSLVQADFIDMTPLTAGTVIQAQVVNGEIWITDQTRDSVYRYSLDGTTHLGTIFGGMDNIRGFEVVGNTVNVSNAGTQNNASGHALVMIDVRRPPFRAPFPSPIRSTSSTSRACCWWRTSRTRTSTCSTMRVTSTASFTIRTASPASTSPSSSAMDSAATSSPRASAPPPASSSTTPRQRAQLL